MALHPARRSSQLEARPEPLPDPQTPAVASKPESKKRLSEERHDEPLYLSEIPGDDYYLPYLAVRAAVDQKGLDVRALDVSTVTNIADVFVIVSGTSERHVESLSDKIRTALGKAGQQPERSNGYGSSQWVILDYGSLVVHIFYEPARQHYHFDELWERGRRLRPTPSLEKELRMLHTGMYR